MPPLAEQDIEELIACAKKMIDPPRREMKIQGKTKRNEMTLKSVDERYEFHVFLRQSEYFPENFSIGLVYLPREEPGEIILFRCNGQHGGTRINPHHGIYHIHRISAEDLSNGIRDARVIEHTKEYATFEEALRFFCHRINLIDADRHFPGLTQRRLFPDEEILI